MAARYTRRLQKELGEIQRAAPAGLEIGEVTNLEHWTIGVLGAKDTLYEGEKFQLHFKFPTQYPLEAPEVTFVGNHIPMHPHIYSNGHICLSILYDGWSPVLSVQSVCLSILSMLSSSPVKERPADNDTYVKNAKGRSPKDTKWWFHDDKV
ncbi:ubiquitin-conjugating enzyme 15 [Planoprotostelium fungivorum]|uniref:N-terminal E2 ubiquitin-conjugating enzyme n=1 Tax=Planoprotostelium fungivorum TaxID=1890364 RepID=A0A2P6N0J9_9EUKA|nr:ubiquitin-conjugating enzyme 15 [Planoprotostelium fungivorum]